MKAIDKIFNLLADHQNSMNCIAGYFPAFLSRESIGEGHGLTFSFEYEFTGFSIEFEQGYYDRPGEDMYLVIRPTIIGIEGVADSKLVEDAEKVVEKILSLIILSGHEEVHRIEARRI